MTLAIVALGACQDDRSDSLPAGAGPPVDAAARGTTAASRADLPAVGLTRVASLPQMATAVASFPGRDEVFFGTRTGQVYRVRLMRQSGMVRVGEPVPAIDLGDSTSTEGEGGLLGLTFDRDGRRLLVSHMTPDHVLTVTAVDYRAGSRPLDAASERTVVAVTHSHPWHNGGDITVDPDGNLYLSVGDGSEDPIAQNVAAPLGAIIRIPPGQLEPGSEQPTPTQQQIIAKGLRNPWRISIDVPAGNMWIADVGDLKVEEVDRVALSQFGATPLNFGWPYLEGTTPHNPMDPPSDLDLIGPVLDYDHSPTACAVIGGDVYRGGIDGLGGAYLYGDFCSPEIRAVVIDDAGKVVVGGAIGKVPTSVIAFGTGPFGETYVTNAIGDVYRIDPPDWKVSGVASIDRPEETTTTAAPVETTAAPISGFDPAACGIVDQLTQLKDLAALQGTAAETAFDAIVAEVAGRVPHLPASAASDGATVLTGLATIRSRLAAAGWSAAIVTQTIDDVFAERGDTAPTVEAAKRIQAASSGSCG